MSKYTAPVVSSSMHHHRWGRPACCGVPGQSNALYLDDVASRPAVRSLLDPVVKHASGVSAIVSPRHAARAAMGVEETGFVLPSGECALSCRSGHRSKFESFGTL